MNVEYRYDRGLFSPEKENIFCLTGTEMLDLWNLWTAQQLHHL